jgi:threonine/homoserine efflux transporter RhtA
MDSQDKFIITPWIFKSKDYGFFLQSVIVTYLSSCLLSVVVPYFNNGIVLSRD